MVRNALLSSGLVAVFALAACQAAAPEPASAPAPQPAPAPAARPAPTSPPAQPEPTPASGGVEPSSADIFAAGATRRMSQGVYTEAQATRGAQVFETSCARCHEAEEWVEDAFKRRWTGQTVYRLFNYVHRNMPNDQPGALPRQEYADVLAYMMKLNSLPAGSAELSSSNPDLQDILIDWIQP